MRRWRALAIVPAAAMVLTGSALAQDGTPAAGETENPRQVSPAECVAEPRPVEEIDALLDLNGAGIQPPPAVTITAPLGTNVDPKTDVSIKEAVRGILACLNAGDIPRGAALMTDNGIKRTYWALTVDAQSRENAKALIAAPPQPRNSSAFIRLITVTDASTLDDGRVAAFVVLNEPVLPPSGPETLLFLFKNVDGQWKLDDFADFSILPADYGATPESTPGA